MRRRILLALPIASLACACAEEPTFDERYDTAQETIRETADDIDEDLEAAKIDTDQSETEGLVPAK